MPDITLTDNSTLTVAAIVADTSVIGQTPGSVFHFLSSDILGAMNQPLDKVQINSLSIGFDCRPSFPMEGVRQNSRPGAVLPESFTCCNPHPMVNPTPCFRPTNTVRISKSGKIATWHCRFN